VRGTRPPFCVDAIQEAVRAGGLLASEVRRVASSAPVIDLGQDAMLTLNRGRSGTSTNYVASAGNTVSYSGASLTTG
jgi:hypothetical protein